MLARSRLMDPREHIPDIPDRVVFVDLYRSGKAVGAAAGKCIEEGLEGGGLTGRGEDLDRFSMWYQY